MFRGAISEKGKIYFDVLAKKFDSKFYSYFLLTKALLAIRNLHGDVFIF